MTERIINWGVIGCGDVMERKSGPPLNQPGSRLHAVTRRDAAKGRDFARRFGCVFHPTVEELVADPAVDAVYVATPPAAHTAGVLAAAAAGKPVLVEKEMAPTVAECDAQLAACHAARVPLAVAFYRRSHPVIAKLRETILAGAIGAPRRLWCNDQFPLSHRLDLAHFLLGDIAQIRIAEEDLPPDSHAERGAVLRARHVGGGETVLAVQMHETHDVERLVMDGEAGRLVVHDLKAGRLSRSWRGHMSCETLDQPALDYAHSGCIANVVAHLRRGAPLACSGWDGRQTAVVMAAMQGLGTAARSINYVNS